MAAIPPKKQLTEVKPLCLVKSMEFGVYFAVFHGHARHKYSGA